MDNHSIRILNQPISSMKTKIKLIYLDTIKLKVEQIFDGISETVYSKIWINSANCLIEERPSINFVVVNELGSSILDVRSFDLEDEDVTNFLKCLTPHTVLIVSITAPSDFKFSQSLLNYFTFIDSKLALKFPLTTNSSLIKFDGAILIGYVGSHRLVHWYHEQFSPLNFTHSYEEYIPTPLAFTNSTKIEISLCSPLSISNLNSKKVDGYSGFSSISINGFECIKTSHNNGVCYVFDDTLKPHLGKLIQLNLNDIEDFISGISSGSVCCFLFPSTMGSFFYFMLLMI